MRHLKIICFCLLLIMIKNGAFAQTNNDTAHFYSAPDGIKIYYEVKGTGYPVVLVHGFIVNSQSWKRGVLYYDLLAAGYKVILVDLRGNGRSSHPADCEGYNNDAEAKDIMGIITELGVKRYTAVGYSRGSIITARLMVLDKRVKQAVMGGMGTDFTNPDWPRRIMFYKAFSGENVPELAATVANVKRANLDIAALACMQKYQPSTPKETLAKLKIKVLVICGDKDSDNGKAADLAALFKRSTFKTVPGDHGAAVQTKEFSDAVLGWIK